MLIRRNCFLLLSVHIEILNILQSKRSWCAWWCYKWFKDGHFSCDTIYQKYYPECRSGFGAQCYQLSAKVIKLLVNPAALTKNVEAEKTVRVLKMLHYFCTNRSTELCQMCSAFCFLVFKAYLKMCCQIFNHQVLQKLQKLKNYFVWSAVIVYTFVFICLFLKRIQVFKT